MPSSRRQKKRKTNWLSKLHPIWQVLIILVMLIPGTIVMGYGGYKVWDYMTKKQTVIPAGDRPACAQPDECVVTQFAARDLRQRDPTADAKGRGGDELSRFQPDPVQRANLYQSQGRGQAVTLYYRPPTQSQGQGQADRQGRNAIPYAMTMNAPIPHHVHSLKAGKMIFPQHYYPNVPKFAVLIRNVLTQTECLDLIAFSEGEVHGPSKVAGEISDKRQSQSVDYISLDMANVLWSRVHQFIPAVFHGCHVVSFNPMMRFLRYDGDEKDYFLPHIDGAYPPDSPGLLHQSKITMLLYLNDDYEGGRTKYLDPNKQHLFVAPNISSGMMVLFEHNILHEGEVLSGIGGRWKHVIRADVMYTTQKVGGRDVCTPKTLATEMGN